MTFSLTDVQERINIVINSAKAGGVTKAQITTILTTIATAQGTDTTTLSREIQEPPNALKPHLPGRM